MTSSNNVDTMLTAVDSPSADTGRMADACLLLTCGPGAEVAPYGDVVVLDWASKTVIDEFRYEHQVYEDSQKGLAGASWRGDGRLLATTECELLELDVAPLRLTGTRSFPFLNDVHHVAASEDRIFVCNTGLDCIEVFDCDWKLVDTIDLLGPISRRLRYSSTSLYYKIKRGYEQLRGWRPAYAHLSRRPLFPNTRKLLVRNAYRRKDRELRFSLFRPHILHPNHVLTLDDDVWVTINTTGEIVSLKSGRIIARGLGRRIHDGIVSDGEHFTTNANTNRVIVHEFQPDGPSLGVKRIDKCVMPRSGGFLRGLAVIEDTVFVGLSARRGGAANHPAGRIVALDRATLQITDSWEIPERFGTAVFSVLDATNQYARIREAAGARG